MKPFHFHISEPVDKDDRMISLFNSIVSSSLEITPSITAMVFASVVAVFLIWLFLPKQNQQQREQNQSQSQNQQHNQQNQQQNAQSFSFDSIKSFAEKAPDSVAEQLHKSKHWWDDLAPPFSMNSLEQMEHDPELATYNRLGAHVTHVCFLFHGYRGRSEDLSYLQVVMQVLVEKEKRKIIEQQQTNPALPRQDMIVHNLVANERRTTDGVVNGGERAVQEMMDTIRRYMAEKEGTGDITVSVVGNSLGGIYGRYAIARFAEICAADNETMMLDHKYKLHFNTFCTTATPHLGISKHTYLPLPRMAEIGVAHSMGLTGMDLFRCNDLVKSMATSIKYLKPLGSFRKRIAYANAYGTDFPVPVGTAAFLSDQSTYPHYFEDAKEYDNGCGEVVDNSGLVIATMHTPPNISNPNGEGFLFDSECDDDLVQMSNALDSLGWKKVFIDVRKEIPIGVSLPRNISRKLAPYDAENGISDDLHKKLDDLKAQKGTSVESREIKEAISSSVPLRQSRLSLPLGHNMICAFSRSRISTLMNKGGRPVVDSLAKELVEDIFAWTSDVVE